MKNKKQKGITCFIYILLSLKLFLSIISMTVADWVAQGTDQQQWAGSLFEVVNDDIGEWEGDSWSEIYFKEWDYSPDGAFWTTFRDLETAMIFYTTFEIASLISAWFWLATLLVNYNTCYTLFSAIVSWCYHVLGTILWHAIAQAQYHTDCNSLSNGDSRAILCAKHGAGISVAICVLDTITCILILALISENNLQQEDEDILNPNMGQFKQKKRGASVGLIQTPKVVMHKTLDVDPVDMCMNNTVT